MPEHGAVMTMCQYEGQDILRPATKVWDNQKNPLEASSFPLIPFSNRIENGQFEFLGKPVTLPQNHPDHAHPLHGAGWLSVWTSRSSSAGHCELSVDHKSKYWPWPFRAVYRVEISGAHLKQTLSIENTGLESMPAGLGFHPYFPSRQSALLTFKAKGMWGAGEDQLPQKWLPCRGDTDFTNKKTLTDISFDNCFSGWDGAALIEWRERPYKIRIKGSHELDHAVLYTPLGDPFFCFEPVSHGTNALVNEDVMKRGRETILNIGETMQVSMQIDVLKT